MTDARALRRDSVAFPRALALSVGIQGPTAGVIVGPAFVASIVGGPGAFVQVIALVAMAFIAYAFVQFARRFNTSGSVYAFNGRALGPRYGFVSVWLLLLVYLGFAAGVFASTAQIAGNLLDSAGLRLPWIWVALVGAALTVVAAFASIRLSSLTILLLEGVSIAVIVVVAVAVIAHGGYRHQGLSAAPFDPGGTSVSVLALGVVQVFGQFSGFEGAATLGEETRRSTRAIPAAVAASLAVSAGVYIFFTWIVYNAFPNAAAVAADPAPLVHVASAYVAGWVGTLVNAAGVISGLGAQLALLTAAARLTFALGRDLQVRWLTRTSRVGNPVGALGAVSVVSVAAVCAFAGVAEAETAAIDLIQYAAYLLLVAYALTVVAALCFVWRIDRRPLAVGVLAVGVLVIGYLLYRTFVPLPASPFDRLVYIGAASALLGVAVSLHPRVSRLLRSSPLFDPIRQT